MKVEFTHLSTIPRKRESELSGFSKKICPLDSATSPRDIVCLHSKNNFEIQFFKFLETQANSLDFDLCEHYEEMNES